MKLIFYTTLKKLVFKENKSFLQGHLASDYRK